jgi:6-phosphofructokinase
MSDVFPRGRVAIVVGGGPAPGINGVICSVTIGARNKELDVLGIRDGFKNLVLDTFDERNPAHARSLTVPDVVPYFNRGGSILGTSRTNPAADPAKLAQVIANLKKLGVQYLVTIGGDDTAYSGSQVYKEANKAIRVAHVPKTIDNDLPLPPGIPTFGFETARHHGVEMARALREDAKTTGRWYIVVSMGRAAGHLALGIGKASAATLTVISEEFPERTVTLGQVCDIIIGSIIKRRSLGKPYGLAVLAEGLIEAIGEKQLLTALGEFRLEKTKVEIHNGKAEVSDVWLAQNVPNEALKKLKSLEPFLGGARADAAELMQAAGEDELSLYGTLDRDPFGHMRLGEIEFGRIIRNQIAWRLGKLGLKLTMIDKDLGYELRSADPIPFDVEYTRDLGYGAVKFLLSEASGQYGAIVSVVGGELKPLKFEDKINPETKRMWPRLVSATSETYECAREYMIRLEPKDFAEAARLEKLANVVKMTPEQFRDRFEYLVK